MKKVFLIYGHYKDNSFNAAIKNEFIKQVELNGNSVDNVIYATHVKNSSFQSSNRQI